MKLKSQVIEAWQISDYVKTILHFFMHTVIMFALFLGAVFINEGGEGFLRFFQDATTRGNFFYIGTAIIFLIAMIYLYFFHEHRDFLKKRSNIFLVFTVLEISFIISYLIGKFLHIYARPVSLCALLILLLVNRRAAIVMNITHCLVVFMADIFTFGIADSGMSIFSSLLIGITTGLLAIYLVSNVTSRIKVFIMGVFISIPVIVCELLLELEAGVNVWLLVGYGFTSGMLSVVLMMAMLPFFEYAFNIVTDYRLSELTDHNSKLIRRLIEDAPGTFNHSLTVSTLAESCATAIGENPLLARAAAYYHDIGKLKQPDYFTENQSGYNPHSELAPELSTDIIKAHTRDGYDLIKKYHLPQIFADVACEHHGTLPIRYFYVKALKYTEGELDEKDFSYNGPTPRSKIAAIIMICDGSEAAVRAVGDRDREKVASIVKGIIDERMNRNQFIDCPITMKDLEIVQRTIVASLAGVYHDRVKYPKMKEKKAKATENKSTKES